MPQNRNKPATGTNLVRVHAHNRRVVLEAIRVAGELTRAELTRSTALSTQAVSNITAELLDESMLLAHAVRKTARGQPPVPLSINPDGGFSIGFHVRQHRIVAVLMDLKGTVRGRRSFTVDYPTFATALPLMAKSARALCSKVPRERVLGIGIGLPGPFGVEGITAVGPTSMRGWEDSDSLALLQERTGLSILLENDATSAALGERLYGAAGKLRDFAYIFVGHGLGAGFYLDNRIYPGHWRNAGEIGHVTYIPGGKPCYCGRQGCFERYLSGASLLGHLGLAADHDLGKLDLAEPKYANGIAQWEHEAVPALRQAISVLESLLDPEAVLVGGTLPYKMLQSLVEKAYPLLPSVSVRAMGREDRMQLATSGSDCVALGAASLAILAKLSPDYEVLLKS